MPPHAPHRLHLYMSEAGDLDAAVATLSALSGLTALRLGMHSRLGLEPLGDSDAEEEQWQFLQLPPLGALAALTALHLDGWLQLPPDFYQLGRLRRLTAAGQVEDEWGSDSEGEEDEAGGPAQRPARSLAGLGALARVDVQAGGMLAGGGGCRSCCPGWDASCRLALQVFPMPPPDLHPTRPCRASAAGHGTPPR